MSHKTVIITGANGNLGSYAARRYLTEKQTVLLFVKDKVDRLKNKLGSDLFNKANIIRTNLLDFERIKTNFEQTLNNYELQPVALLHTAAMRSMDYQKLTETNPKFWQKVVANNLFTAYNILKIVIPYMRKQKEGRIVLLGSNVSKIGLEKGSAYAAAKAAIANLSKTIAREEAEKNILINTVSPGPIKIDNSNFSPEYRKFRERYYQKEIETTPLKKLATLKEVFELCDFLLSEKNTHITGEEFFITGGK